jgi:hypothetical protein
MSEPIKFVAQLNQIKSLKDGGGRITFDFSLDGLSEVQRLQRLNGMGEMNFMIVCVPMHKSTEIKADTWDKIEV